MNSLIFHQIEVQTPDTKSHSPFSTHAFFTLVDFVIVIKVSLLVLVGFFEFPSGLRSTSCFINSTTRTGGMTSAWSRLAEEMMELVLVVCDLWLSCNSVYGYSILLVQFFLQRSHWVKLALFLEFWWRIIIWTLVITIFAWEVQRYPGPTRTEDEIKRHLRVMADCIGLNLFKSRAECYLVL